MSFKFTSSLVREGFPTYFHIVLICVDVVITIISSTKAHMLEKISLWTTGFKRGGRDVYIN